MSGLGIKSAHCIFTPGKTVAECAAQKDPAAVDVGGPSTAQLDARLTELTGKRFRRVGRFIHLALSGAVEAALAARRPLPPQRTAVLLATGLGNLSDLVPFTHAVFGDPGYHVSAIQFANSVGNAGAFHIAQALDLEGPVLALSQDEVSFEAALVQARALLEGGDVELALVGAVDVVTPSVHDHLARMGHAPDAPLKLSEGSAWWLMGEREQGDLGTLESVELAHQSGPSGVHGGYSCDAGEHYAKSGVWATRWLQTAAPAQTLELVSRTREGLTARTRVRRGDATP